MEPYAHYPTDFMRVHRNRWIFVVILTIGRKIPGLNWFVFGSPRLEFRTRSVLSRVVISVPPGRCRYSNSIKAAASTYHVLSITLFFYHFIIWRCVAWDTECSLNKFMYFEYLRDPLQNNIGTVPQRFHSNCQR